MPSLRDRIRHLQLHKLHLRTMHRMHSPFALRVISAGLIGLLTAGCQSSDLLGDRPFENLLGGASNNPQAIRQPRDENGLKLGAMLPAVGDLGQRGRPMLQTLPLLVDTVNRCGGVNDAFVSLVLEDEAAQPLEAAVKLKKLAEADRVSAIVGGFSSEVSAAAIPVAVQEKVLLISPASSSPQFTDRAKQSAYKGFWARTIPSDVEQAKALAQLAEKQGFRTVAIVTANTPDRVALEQAFIAAFEKRGGTVRDKTLPLRYSLNADAFTLEELTYAAFRPFDPPDAVLAILDRNAGAAMLKAAEELGFTQGIPVLLTDSVRFDAFTRRVGNTAEGKALMADAIGTIAAADGPGYTDFAQQWQEQFNSPPGEFTAQTWDAAALVMLAAQAANSNSREGIRSELREVANPPGITVTDVCEGLALLRDGQEINYDGASGKVDINPAGDVQGEYDVWRVDEEGRFQEVDRLRPNS